MSYSLPRIKNPMQCLYCERPSIAKGLCTMHRYRWIKKLPMEAPKLHEQHGDATNRGHAPEYSIWKAIIQRCTNPKNAAFEYYGGRGIAVCAAWRESYSTFLADVGKRPSAAFSLDRIDNGGGYEPGNCRWVRKDVQMQNRRTVLGMQREIADLKEQLRVLRDQRVQ